MAPELSELEAGSNNASAWESHYREGHAPWDKGAPTPSVSEIIKEPNFGKRILVPGCGRGHDAAAFARAGYNVMAIDIAETGIADAKKLYPDVAHIFRVADLFTLEEQFDCIFEHTCYCAIHPEHRPMYVESVLRVLKPEGRFFGVLYVTDEAQEISGPPFRIPRDIILDPFKSMFDIAWRRPPAQSFPSRKGSELLVELIPRKH